MKYNIKLSIKAIIRAEQMLLKPFTEIDYTNIDDLTKLLYCAVLVNNRVLLTFEEFQNIAENEKQFASMIKELEKANKVLEQFARSDEQGSGGIQDAPQYIKDLAGMLIMSGLDAHFVLDEMEISDIPVFIEAYEKRNVKIWRPPGFGLFCLSPPPYRYKKIRSVEDFFLFPWEVEAKKKKAEAEMNTNIELFNRFMSGEFTHLLNN